MWSMDVGSHRRYIQSFLHIYTVIAPMHDPFQEYSVKKGQFVCLFLNTMIGNTSNFDASKSVHGVYH